MNNFQNNFGKFLSPPTVLANPTSIYRTEHKKSQQETRNLQELVETKTSEALKIFYESKTFKPDEPQFDWNVKRKRSRLMAAKSSVGGKTKSKKKHTNTKGDVTLGLFESKKLFAKKKPKTQIGLTKQASQKTFFLTLGKNEEEAAEKQKRAFETPRKILLNPIKMEGDTEKKQETKLPFPKVPSTTPSVTRKVSEKSTKPLETKAVVLDVGKKAINEILKNHAQKTPSYPVKALLLKEPNLSKDKNQQQKASVSTIKSGGTGEKADDKQSTKQEKSTPKPPDSKQEVKESEVHEEKKKIPISVLSCPTSIELERRLNNSGKENDGKFDGIDQSTDDEGHSVSSGKTDKRITYTDRLLTVKLNGKVEEKRTAESKEIVRDRKKKRNSDGTGKSETALVKTPPVVLKDILLGEKDVAFKVKQTNSTELRDMVAHAIREHKIFCIFDNHSYIVRPVREELLSRGWLEVIPDRRLIPRRRPPPTGPVFERDKTTLNEQNCNSLQAILAAKEIFATEIEETVSKSAFKLLDKGKVQCVNSKIVTKKSEESISEVASQFRIIPPNNEKKKNNIEIRDFVVKYQTYIAREREREIEIRKIRERDDIVRLKKKEREGSNEKGKPLTTEVKSDSVETIPLAKGSISVQNIANFIQSNKKTILEAKMNFKSLEIPGETPPTSSDEKPTEAPVIIEEKVIPKHKTYSFKSSYSDSEAKAISKMIQMANARIHFMWLSIKPGIHLKCFNYSPEIINKFQKTTFCTKIGLWSHLNNMQWYAHEVHHPAKSPRMYNTGEADDLQAFFQDFHLTACIGMLKWLCDTLFERGLRAVQTKKGKVPLKAFEFAIKQCERFIRYKENEELNLLEEPKLNHDEWCTFLQYFYSITNDNGKIQEGSSAQIMVVYTKGMETLKAMRRYWPEMDIDGRLNIWIMKPYCASCGRGIFMTNNVYYIGQHSKYIVQKYIEKPLLIYNTKFDIRQWFMVTKLTPLEIWMYRECYLRFCSQPFALRNLHESVHLSNNSVQRKYINIRDSSLPDQNMWDSSTFQLYLKTIGFPNAWEDIIYPGMRDAIVSTMLAAQDTFDGPRRSWFEVYGADFMLSANLKEGPWLIEINENPAMDPSTKVTSRLCPQMLRDVIKVVVDKRANKNANTGQWELIYRQNYSPSFGTVDLDVRGKRIARIPYSSNVTSSVTRLFKNPKRETTPKEAGNKLEKVTENENGSCTDIIIKLGYKYKRRMAHPYQERRVLTDKFY